MSNLRQAAQQAFEVLVEINKLSIGEHAICLPGEIDTAMDALRAALAEPDSDYERGFVDGMNLQTKGSVDKAVNRMAQTTHWEGCEAVHPECRKPEQEPDGISWLKRDSGYFTAPTPRKPLSEQELDAMRQADGGALNFVTLRAFRVVARAVERAHGIGEQT